MYLNASTYILVSATMRHITCFMCLPYVIGMYIFLDGITRTPLIKLMCMNNGFISVYILSYDMFVCCGRTRIAIYTRQMASCVWIIFCFVFQWINVRAYWLVVFIFHITLRRPRIVWCLLFWLRDFYFEDKSSDIKGFVLHQYFSHLISYTFAAFNLIVYAPMERNTQWRIDTIFIFN